MSSFMLTIVCLCVLVMTVLTQSNWNQEMRDYILDIHNEKRRGEGGCQMNKLVYDEELENQAKKWAERCVYKHETKEGRGENLFFSTYQKSEKNKILHASDSWFNEKNDYSFGQNSCWSSCHYTQMVWHETSKVGCYAHTCSYLTGAAKNAWYLVCFYTPKGNWDGEKPYEKSCKTKCREGQTEEKGLCVDEAKEVCKDNDDRCAMWAKNNQCDGNRDYIKKECKKSCKVCVSESSRVDSTPKPAKNEVVLEGSNDGCKDDNVKCEMWAKNKQCKEKPKYMEVNCKKSCKVCQ